MGKEEVRAEDLHRVLDAEVSKLQTASEWSRWLDVAALFPTYGFGNLVLINLQMPQASWVARAQQWEQLGRRVKTAQGIRILKPIRVQKAMAEAGGHHGVEGSVEDQVIGFRVGVVYDVTATVGPPIHLPRPPVTPDATVARDLWDGLAQDAAADGFAVDVRPTGDASEGFTDYGANRIVIADHLDDFRAVARLAHEMGHVRMHSPSGPDASATCRGTREVEAESVAYVLLAHHGLSIDAESFDYIAGWARQVDPNEPGTVIKATGARVVTTARQLIDSTDKYLNAHRAPLAPVQTRPLDSAPDFDGPAL
ncbi:ImmA/IrrE family metallo-endopeptidase [Kribbella sp. C-35]|uniref:ImmA/IrrE family metallo-endopeptidase n=1 Tax=Kribbella sp. C-35 TaxID=2789276 RepID=UPI00397AACA1